MKLFIYFNLIGLLVFSCNQPKTLKSSNQLDKGISIFEIYLNDSLKVDDFSAFLRDTLELPVEWEPFDIFGNEIVYDAAFYLGNTTLELLSVNPPIKEITEEATYNRILFDSNNIDSTSIALSKSNIDYKPAFDFKISSNDAQLTIGKQINIDSMSKKSNVNIAYWQYLNSGYNFSERTIKGSSKQKLISNLNAKMSTNPMGIIALKEVHLYIDEVALKDWQLLFGEAINNKWILERGPIISYTITNKKMGVEWISLKVKDLNRAKTFLSERNLLSIKNYRTAIDSKSTYGLKIFIEE